MNSLCFSTELTSAELASWVQAIGSILAILAAALIAIWQSKKQHESSFTLHKEEQRHNRLEQAKALLVICQNCTKVAKYCSSKLKDRETIHLISDQQIYDYIDELQTLINATSNIPLYSLPSTLITHAMTLGATIRQVKQSIDTVIKVHRKMDAEQFQLFFDNHEKMNESLELISGDIEAEVRNIVQLCA